MRISDHLRQNVRPSKRQGCGRNRADPLPGQACGCKIGTHFGGLRRRRQLSRPACGGIQRAKADDSIEIEGSASYSIIGDTTPSTFYEALNGKMMADGFLSRFVVIEYHGQRPPLNESRQPFHPDAVRWFCNIVGQAVQRFAREPQLVPPDADALQRLRDFDRQCDQNLNATENEARRQMWNRAHLNALKVATLLAVADSYGTREPVVTAAHADWAIALIMRNIANMQTRATASAASLCSSPSPPFSFSLR